MVAGSFWDIRDADHMGDWFPVGYREAGAWWHCVWEASGAPTFPYNTGEETGRGQLYLSFTRSVLVHALLGPVTTSH